LSVNVTHNNNGHHYRIAIDIAKEGAEVFDLTPYFKGRVGDNNFGLQIVWYYQGQLLDVEGMKPFIQGNVGHYSFDDKKNLQMAPDAGTVSSTGDPKDCQANGQALYRFPEQMFPKEGIFKGFIGLLDDSDDGGHTHLTGVNIWFRVLGGVAQMGRACDFYISDLDTAIANAKEKLRQAGIEHEKEFEKILSDLQTKQTTISAELDKLGSDSKQQFGEWLAKYKQALQDALAAVDDPKEGLLVRYNALNAIAKQIQETLKDAQFHDRVFQYENIEKMKAALVPMPGDLVVTQGWEARDDARGGFWRIRVKRDNETANGTTTIELGTGYIAERDFGIVQDMAPIHMGTVTYEAKADADGFVDLMPPVHMYVSKYGAGIAQVDVDEAGGSEVSEVKVQPVFDGNKCEIYISPADIRFRMPGINLETPSSAECDGPNVYVVSNIYTLTLSLKGAKATGFTIDKDFITEYRDLMTNL